jgi:acetoin utilization deacetylase AcuC-like enzyme
MKFGHRDICLEHDTGPRHPETADRIRAIRQTLAKRHGVEYEEGRLAEMSDLAAVHDSEYIDEVEGFCADGGGNWDADTVAVEETWEAARAAAGLACWAIEEAIDGADGRQTPFSIGRPPGHHAEVDEAMGFCFFNNAAVAAQWAIDHEDTAIDRAVIFDWDVHHGNGTQDIFYDSAEVFYASIHERELFPGTGAVDETGGPDASGTTLNAPLPGGSGDSEYAAIVDDVLDPALERFDPDLFIVSAGFDAHRHDPISRMRVSTEGYGHLTNQVRAIADRHDAPLAFVLEGGYGLDSIAESVGMIHEVFDGREPVTPDGDIAPKVQDVIEGVREAHDL